MKLDQLERFVEVAQHGSLSKAAASMNKSQAILSRQIKSFEQEMGAPLFQRTGRGVVLNAAGTLLLARAEHILDEVQKAQREVKSVSNTQIVHANIAIPTIIARRATTHLIPAIFEAFPDIRLHITENASGQILEMVMGRKVDIALLYDNVAVQRSMCDHLCLETMYIVRHASGKKLAPTTSIKSLVNRPLILPSTGSGLRRMIDTAATQAGVKLISQLEADTLTMIKQLVEAGYGSAILPLTAVQPEIRDGTLVASRLVEPEITRNLLITSCSTRLPSAALNELTRIIKRVILHHVGSHS
jgi:LysR family nitrogen assimilation transcriptional regulator